MGQNWMSKHNGMNKISWVFLGGWMFNNVDVKINGLGNFIKIRSKQIWG